MLRFILSFVNIIRFGDLLKSNRGSTIRIKLWHLCMILNPLVSFILEYQSAYDCCNVNQCESYEIGIGNSFMCLGVAFFEKFDYQCCTKS